MYSWTNPKTGEFVDIDLKLDNQTSIIDTIFGIDFSKLITKLEVENNGLSLGLDLSKFLSSLDNLEATISKDGEALNVALNKLDLKLNVKPTNDAIIG